MTPSKSTAPTEGTYDIATSHDQFTVAQEEDDPKDTVQHLIAFASTILNHPIHSEKRISVENDRRVSRILDSIANISISQARGEVVAVAAQLTRTDIKLVVTSNNTLPASTIIHLKSVWDILKQLCQDYQNYNFVPEHTISRKRPATKHLNQAAQMRVNTLRRMILRFNHQKLRRRVSEHYMDSMSINTEVAKELGLEPIITKLRMLRVALNQGFISDDHWDSVWRILAEIRSRFDETSNTIKTHENTPRVPFPLFRFLAKVVSIENDTIVLMKAAHSPSMRSIFHRNFQVINLEGSKDMNFDLPESPAGWTSLVEDTLRWRNMTAKIIIDEVKFQLDQIKIQQHIATMCETPPRATSYAHCELNIISYILQSSEDGFLAYIGASKLSCMGCFQYIQAVNCVVGKQFKTNKCTHQKFHYPWRFPTLPRANNVAEQMRNTMCFVFGKTYQGFCPETRPYLGNGEATASSRIDGEKEPGDRALEALQGLELENAKSDGSKKR